MEYSISPAVNQIVSEIISLNTQYSVEVTKKRAQWPNSIKSWVLDLRDQGLNYKEIFELTGIPATIYKWRRPVVSSFKSLTLIESKPVSVSSELPVAIKMEDKLSSPPVITVTVIMPGGIRIEGLDQAAALKFALGCVK